MMHFQILTHTADYLPDSPVQELAVASRLASTADGTTYRIACVSDQIAPLRELVEQGLAVEAIAERLQLAVLDFSQPWRLVPVAIPKPWGQEIWYTGMEARGVSAVASDTGSTPLPWAIAVSRQGVLGMDQQRLNLLKILDPLAEPVFGDLYFELHEEKREVYIVTHVAPTINGHIRLGFSQQKRAGFVSDAAFKAAYLADVSAYRDLRERIDTAIDGMRARDGVGLNEPVAAAQLRLWLAEIPAELQQAEQRARAQIDSYSELSPLTVGDVVAVPLLTPHSLQHGVRTVEFQTPVYERKILSFAQKVLTQAHWDTAEALAVARLDIPPQPDFPTLHQADGVRVEAVVEFDDFCVQRIFLEPGASLEVPTMLEYLLLMCVAGELQAAASVLQPEQAVLVPAAASSIHLKNSGAAPAIALLANPV